MDTLFEMPEAVATEPPQDRAGTGHTCGQCANAVRPHHYRSDWIYCKVTPCKRTQFGIMKVRSRQPACPMFSNMRYQRAINKTKKEEV